MLNLLSSKSGSSVIMKLRELCCEGYVMGESQGRGVSMISEVLCQILENNQKTHHAELQA
jgi:hypothetical protein